VAGAADTTVVLLAPGMGDGIQAAKAGILEVADVLVVNKGDREGAERTTRDLRHAVAMGDRPEHAWRPPVLRLVATSGEGVDRLLAAVDEHREHLGAEGLRERRTRRAAAEVEGLALEALRARVVGVAGERLTVLAADVVAGRTDPWAAADRLVAEATDTA